VKSVSVWIEEEMISDNNAMKIKKRSGPRYTRECRDKIGTF